MHVGRGRQCSARSHRKVLDGRGGRRVRRRRLQPRRQPKRRLQSRQVRLHYLVHAYCFVFIRTLLSCASELNDNFRM